MTPRFRTVAGEVLSILRSHALLTLVVVLIALLSSGTMSLMSLHQLGGISAQQHHLREAGYDVWRVQTVMGVSARDCDALRGVEGVADAGAQTDVWQARVVNTPGAVTTVVAGTPGYVRIVWNLSPDHVPTVGAGSEVSARLGLRVQQYLRFDIAGSDPRNLQIDAVYPPTTRVNGANQWVSVATPAGSAMVTECLVAAQPGARAALERLLTVALGSETSVSPLADMRGNLGPSPETQLQQRLTQWTPLAVTLVLIVTSAAFHFIRRAEWALYRVLGLGRGRVMWAIVLETALTIYLPMLVGLAIPVLVDHAGAASIDGGLDPLVVAGFGSDAARVIIGSCLVPVIAFWVINRRSALARVKGE